MHSRHPLVCRLHGLLLRSLVAGSLLAAACAAPARAGTTTTTFQPAPASVDDDYLREDNTSEQNGTRPDIRVRSSSDPHDRNIIISVPFTGMASRTILRAWLEL